MLHAVTKVLNPLFVGVKHGNTTVAPLAMYAREHIRQRAVSIYPLLDSMFPNALPQIERLPGEPLVVVECVLLVPCHTAVNYVSESRNTCRHQARSLHLCHHGHCGEGQPAGEGDVPIRGDSCSVCPAVLRGRCCQQQGVCLVLYAHMHVHVYACYVDIIKPSNLSNMQ